MKYFESNSIRIKEMESHSKFVIFILPYFIVYESRVEKFLISLQETLLVDIWATVNGVIDHVYMETSVDKGHESN